MGLNSMRLLTASLVLAASGLALAQELPLAHFAPGDPRLPLPSSSVQAVYQDRLGFVWLGFLSSGLARYDGHSLEPYGLEDGLADATVRGVVEDGAGHLWVATDAGLSVSDLPLDRLGPSERVRFLRRVGGAELVASRVRPNAVSVSETGEVWVGTAGEGVLRYRFGPGGDLEVGAVGSGAGGSPAPLAAVAVRRSGELWVARDDGSLEVAAAGAERLDPLAPWLAPTAPVTAFAEGPGGVWWAGCRDGSLWRLEGPGGRFALVDRSLTEPVSVIRLAADGTLWVGSLGAGILRVEPEGRGGATLLSRRHGLPSVTIWALGEDREGNLWVGHDAGLSRLRAGYRAHAWFTAASSPGAVAVLPDPTVFAVLPPAADGSGSLLWAGTGGGLAAVLPDEGRSAWLGPGSGLQSASVYALARDGAGRVWVGSLEGLDLLAPGAAGTAGARVVVHDRVWTLTGDPVGTVYGCFPLDLPAGDGDVATVPAMVVCGTEGVTCYAGGERFRLGAEAGLPAAGATCAARDGGGRLWVGTHSAGVFRTSGPLTLERLRRLATGGPGGGEVRTAVLEPHWHRGGGALSDTVHDLEWDGARMWVATGAGVQAVVGDPPRAEVSLDRGNGLGGDRAAGVASDPDRGSLWVAQDEGLAEVDLETGQVRRLLSALDGLIDDEAWRGSSLAVGPDGAVYLGTPKGVSVYRPDLDRRSRVAPLVVLRSATLEQDAWGHNEALFEYAALTFTDEAAVRYRTRLRGFESDWSAPTAEVRARFTDLPAHLVPRRYVFEVTAVNANGVWAEHPVSRELLVEPAWWLRWWAVGVWVLGLVGAGWGLTAARTRRLKGRARALEELVAEHTAEIRVHLRELETLDRIVEIINREVALDRVMEAVLQHGLALVPQASRALFLLRDPEGGQFEILASSTGSRTPEIGTVVSVDDAMRRYTAGGEELAQGVFLLRRRLDASGASIFGDGPPVTSLLTLDLFLAGRVEGLTLFELADVDAVADADLRALQRYRQHAISALDKARVMRALEQKSREAAQANAAKSAFLATVSHELRTPLNSIIGFSEVLLDKLELDEQSRYRRFLANVNASGRHLLGLINDILDLAKVEAGKLTFERHPIVVPDLVDGVCRIMMAEASRQGVDLAQDVAADLPPIVGDGPKLKQVLYNLISNAVKFSFEGGTVTVSARVLSAGSSPLQARSLELTVADQGVGIARPDQERIFDEFQRLEGGPGRTVVGTGLGLTLTRRLVELQGGRITVDSALGEGSVFRVLLPATPQPGRGEEGNPVSP